MEIGITFFTVYLLCIFFSSFRYKLQFSSSFAADRDGWNGETYHLAIYIFISYNLSHNFPPAIYNENNLPSFYVV